MTGAAPEGGDGRPSGAAAASLSLRVRIATLFGVGWFPVASGTVGSAAVLPLAAALAWLGPWIYGGFTIGVIALALWSAHGAERALGLKDPHAVIIDEAAGQLVSLALVPLSAGWYAAGFFLFRVFDILKPFPARRLERLPGGPGIVLDDLAAGIYANLILQAVRRFSPWGPS